MPSNRFTVEGIARGVPLRELYDFYTDYSPEDVDIMRKHGMNMALEPVAEREGNHVAVDTTAKVMGMTRDMKYDITLHPDEHWYEMTTDIEGFVSSRRKYKFEEVPEGTKVTIEDQYRLTSFLSKMLGSLGMLRKKMVGDTTRTMNAFIAEAEERFGGASRVQPTARSQ
jgi:hypothetical protein